MKRSLFAATFAVVCAVSVAARATPTVAPSAKTPKRQNAKTPKRQNAKTPSKTAPNAYDFYLRATKALSSLNQEQEFYEFADPPHTQRQVAAWRKDVLARNANALSLLRQGFRHSYSRPSPPSEEDPLFVTELMDPLARILSTEADVYVARGDYARAVSNGVDGVRWGTDLARDGDILALENGLLIEGSGFNNIKRSSIDRLDVRSAQALALRLEILDACRFSYTRTLQNEKITGLKRLEMIFKFQDWRKNLPTTQSSAQIITTYERLMNETIIDVALPYPRRRGVSVDGADALSKVIFGTLARQDATHLSTMGSGSFYENLRAISRLDATMLALRAFKAEHGKYPMTLSELTPTILRRVPVDPFSDKPLRYKLKAIEYSLYSVGYDGVDDGGKALPKRAKPNAKGDIVAGVNTP